MNQDQHPSGRLLIIGGSEDREDDKAVLERFELPELIDVRLHVLPTGSRHQLGDGVARAPALTEFVRIATTVSTAW